MSTSEIAGALSPGFLLHEYRLERILGHGGFGITYLARDTHLDKVVAIKEYLPADLAVRSEDNTVTPRASDARESFAWGLDNFLKEARMLARFSHPNLIRVHRYFQAHGTAYFVMEYAEGTTLAAELRQAGTLPEARIRNVLLPIMSGLEAVHREGILHRDIKPDNIILRSDGSPVLIDFGAARQNLGSMTRSILSVLTAGYAPLEQYASSGNQGPWTDLYALGAVAYRALSGRKPAEAVNRVRDDPLVPASLAGSGRYSPHFLAAVDWALEVDPEDRPGSIVEWRQALDGKVSRASPQVLTGMAADAPADPTLVLPKEGPREVPVAPTAVLPRAGGPGPARTRLTRVRMAAGRVPLAVWGISAAAVMLAFVLTLLFVRHDSPARAPADAVTAEFPPAQERTPPPREPEPQPAAPPAQQTPNPSQEPAPKKKAAPRKPAPQAEAKLKPVGQMPALAAFRDCPQCPEMVALPAGTFQMGTPKGSAAAWEGPQHAVTVKPFAAGRHEVTTAEWDACVKARECPAAQAGPFTGDASRVPVVHVNWQEAQGYARWLARITGRPYRLPSEAEWEYAARGGTATSRYWGDDRRGQCLHGNGADQSALTRDSKLPAVECDDGFAALAPAGSFKPNAFGLFDVAGNAWEWTLDCWKDSYTGAPGDGRAVDVAGCTRRVIRGGSFLTRAESLRSSNRGVSVQGQRSEDLGFRVVAD